MQLKTLNEIAVECGTDKAWHGYTHFYGTLLAHLRDLPVTVLEVGVDGGESIKMWDRYFTHPETTIYGVDVHDKGGEIGHKSKFILGDATKDNFIFDLINLTGPFDLIVEDASHYSVDQKKTLHLLWPHLKPGGIFIMEDCHCSFTYPWTEPGSESFVDYTMKWIKDIHEHGKDHHAIPKTCNVEEMVVRKSLTVFKKSAAVHLTQSPDSSSG